MTPQHLLNSLFHTSGDQGRRVLQTYVPLLSKPALDEFVSLLKQAIEQYPLRSADVSLTLSEYVLFIADLTRNASYHALGTMLRGNVLLHLEQDQEASSLLEAAGREFLSLNDELGWAQSRIGLTAASLRLNRTTEALREASVAREIFLVRGERLLASLIDVQAASVNYELGQYDQALRLFDRALENYAQLGESAALPLARARGNKALALAALGKFREAVALHEQAMATFMAAGESEEISVAREEMHIADIYAAQGHYSQALHLYNRSRDLFLKYEMSFAASEVAQQMCLCLVRLNRAQEADELADEVVKFFRASPGQRQNLARSLMHQAAAATMMGDHRKADEMLQEASGLLSAGGFARLAALARLRRAELYFADAQLEASLREARYVADVFADQEDLPNLARAALLQAAIAEKQGDPSTAHYLCENALDIALGQGLLDLTYRCYELLGLLAEQRDDLATAVSYYDRALRGIDEIQSRLVLDERTSFLEDKESIYQRAMALALKRGDKDQALIYIEKSKSRVLGDYIRNHVDIRLRAGDEVGEAILGDLARLREEQAWFSSIVYETEDGASHSETAAMRLRSISPEQARLEMQQRERAIERLLEKLQLRSAGDLVSRQRTNWTNSIITSLWPNLDDDMLILEYYLSHEDMYIFSLTREGVDVQVVNGAKPKLERLMALWRTNLDVAAQSASTASDLDAFEPLYGNGLGLLRRLYDLLLRPVASLLNACKHLIVVPYGMLHYLPFHCLFDGNQFVVERWYVSYLPATSLLDVCQERGQHILAQKVRLSDSLILGLSEGGRLSFAVREAEAVAQQLGARCALNEKATASLLWEAGERSPVIHIAAHGLFRLDSPNFSYIKLADRQLSTIEVFNLNLSACSLVTLSACGTGRAVIGGVDEVIGLGRGFLYAGAASLLSTLWKVEDASSAELMVMFYQALASGYTKAAALAQAQRAFLKRALQASHRYRTHPYFWAAFHLSGDPGPLLAKPELEEP